MSKKYFFIGAVSVMPFVLMVHFSFMAPIGRIGVVLGCLASQAIVGLTNFCRDYWTYEGYSNSLQSPWPIEPTQRPRIGGFATGFAAISFLTILAVMFLMDWS